MIVLLYVGAILSANLLSSIFSPINIGPFAISPGTFTIAASFILRDLVQNKYGRVKTYRFIGLAMALSVVMALLLSDGMPIVIASAAAFIVSETTDTEIYTRMKACMAWRVWWSGVFGGILDSSVFVVLGLSPLGMNFIPWQVIPMAIIGQAIFKVLMQGMGAISIAVWERRSVYQ